MPKSVLEAIQEGMWDYEPHSVRETEYDSTSAIPGSEEKLLILAERAARGLPLWHRSDRLDYEKLAQSEPLHRRSPASTRS